MVFSFGMPFGASWAEETDGDGVGDSDGWIAGTSPAMTGDLSGAALTLGLTLGAIASGDALDGDGVVSGDGTGDSADWIAGTSPAMTFGLTLGAIASGGALDEGTSEGALSASDADVTDAGISALGIEPMAVTWVDVTDDPVWGNAKVYPYVVNSWPTATTGLKAALGEVGAYNANLPYIILIGSDIQMTETYELAGKNVVLRKTTATGGSAVNKDNYLTGAAPWNYNNPYDNTTAASPALYDGVSDWNITSASDARHFLISGSGTASLTTENITLNGGIAFDDLSSNGGGIKITATGTVDLRANVINSHWTSQVGGGGVSIEAASTVNVKGGVIAKNRQTAGGASNGSGGIGIKFNITAKSLNLTGYTIIEDNQASGYGGGVYIYSAGTCVFDGNVLIRRNEGCNGGGIFLRNNITLTIKGNVTISQNRAAGETAGSAAMYAGTGGGALFSGIGTATITIAENATFDGNTATRGGGGIYFNSIDKPLDSSKQGVTLNLTGGRFINNQALGTARDLAEGAQAEVAYAIGGGGAIFTYYPKTIKIPAYSTTYFNGNLGTFSAFIDNTELQTLDNTLHQQSFFSGDNYISHIENAAIHTSLVNVSGPLNYDYYNLYNNYDIGMPNNLTLGLFTPVNVSVLPADGSGGQVTEDSGNVYIDPLQTGVKQAALNSTLKFTPVEADGWRLASFVAQTDPALTEDELTAAWTHSSNLYTLTVPGSDTTLVATFHRNAVLTAPEIVFEPNFTSTAYQRPNAIDVTLTNTSPDDGYSDSASSITVSLSGGDSSAFTLIAGSGSVAPGATNTSWKVQPNAAGSFTEAKTYKTTVHVVYNNGEDGGHTLDIPVSIDINNAGDLYLPGASAGGAFDWGTYVLNGEDLAPEITAKAITIQSVGGDGGLTAYDATVTLVNERLNGNPAAGAFELTGDPVASIENGGKADTPYWIVKARPFMAGDYKADLQLTYTLNGVEQTKTMANAVHIKIVAPASVAVKDTTSILDAEIDFGILNIGYASNALSFKNIVLENSGDLAAGIVSVELSGSAIDEFRISGPVYVDDETVIGTVPAGGSNANTWSIIPKQGLAKGVHVAAFIVTYKTGNPASGQETATAIGRARFTVDGPPDVRWYTIPPPDKSLYWYPGYDFPPTTTPHLQNIPATNGRVYLGFDEAIDPAAGGTVTLIPEDGSAAVVLNISDGVWNAQYHNAWGEGGIYNMQGNEEGYIEYAALKADTAYTVEITGLVDPIVEATDTQVQHGGNTMTAVKTFSPKSGHAALAGIVTVTGDAYYGGTLTANTGLLVTNPVGAAFGDFSYQWKRNGNNIGGATHATYTLTAADVGCQITVTISSSNTTGSVDYAGILATKRPVTISAAVADKAYDGTDAAKIASTELIGVLPADASAVQVVTGTGVYSDIGSPETDTTGLDVTFTGFDITGNKAINYALTGQPASQTAAILKGFEAVRGTQYEFVLGSYVTPTDYTGVWSNAANSLQAKEGYLLSSASAAEGSWSSSLSLGGDYPQEVAPTATTFYVKNTATGEISRAHQETAGTDRTLPTGSITVKSNGFTTFLNNITFGLFFKNTLEVTITGADTGSETANSEYNASATKYIVYEGDVSTASCAGPDFNLEVNGSPAPADWTRGETLTLPGSFKGAVFAVVYDYAGNGLALSTNGIVIYTDSTYDGSTLSYTKTSLADKSAALVLNGNTVKSVSVGANVLTPDADYVLGDGTITLKASYLETLAAGGYTVNIVVNPKGEEYADAAGNDTPEDVSIPLTVSKAVGSVTWPTATPITYGVKLSEVTLSGGAGSGGGQFSWQADADSVYPGVTNTGYVLTFTPADPDSYDFTQLSGYDGGSGTVKKTISLTVSPRKLTGVTDDTYTNGFLAIGRSYDGSDSATVNFTANNLAGGDTAGSVYRPVVRAHFADGAGVGQSKLIIIEEVEVLSENYTAPTYPSSLRGSIEKAPAISGLPQTLSAKENVASSLTLDLTALLPSPGDGKSLGTVSYSIGTPTDASGFLDGAPSKDSSNVLHVNVKASAQEGNTAVIPVTITSSNYNDIMVNVAVEIVGNVPLITVQPVGTNPHVYIGDPFTLSVTAQSSEPMEVRWYIHGNPETAKVPVTDWIAIGSGTQTATYEVNTAVGTATDYSVDVRNTEGTSTSQEVPVAVFERVYEALLAPAAKDFGEGVYGYASAGTQVFTITNSGNQALTGAGVSLGADSAFEITQVNGVAASSGTAVSLPDLPAKGTVTVTVRPKAGLAAADYSGTLTLTYTDRGADGKTPVAATKTAALSWKVDAAPGELVISDPDAQQTLSYTNKPVKPGVEKNESGGALTWWHKKNGEDSFSEGLPVNVGSYEVYAVSAATQNYTQAESNHVAFDIQQKKVTVTITVADKDYDGTDGATISRAVINGLADGDVLGTDVTLVMSNLTFDADGTPDNVNNLGARFAGVGDPDADRLLETSLPTGLTGGGPKMSNYQITGVTVGSATIRAGFTALAGTHYEVPTPNDAGWVKADYTVTAEDGYQVGLTALAQGAWTNAGTALTLSTDETANGTAVFYIREISTGRISRSTAVGWKMDKTAPGASIDVRGNKFTEFLNGITFGFFFKNTVDVTISGTDEMSGIDTSRTQYYKDDVPLVAETDWDSISWTDGSAFSIEGPEAVLIYARVYDYAGNYTVVNTSGLVVYEDSSTNAAPLAYTRTTKENQSFTFETNGNSVGDVYVIEKSVVDELGISAAVAAAGPLHNLNNDVTDGSDYEEKPMDTITLSGAYLDKLPAGEYVVALTIKPFTYQYVAENGGDVNSVGADENDAPGILQVKLTVNKKTPVISDILAGSVVYGARLSDSAVSAVAKDGEGNVAAGTVAWNDGTLIPGYDSVGGLEPGGYTFKATWTPSDAAGSFGTDKASDYFTSIEIDAVVMVTQAVPRMKESETPAGSSILLDDYNTLADSVISGNVVYDFAGNAVAGTNPTGETAASGTWYWDENGDGLAYGVDDAETQNPADSSVNHTAGVKHVSAVFVPSDP
ncbi:MAG: YDG domain-containing protein, partial [Clostridiales Family XIII bacterium]|nr:YDG domain-containing protein [Clostridiales Family XIII bacterium]